MIEVGASLPEPAISVVVLAGGQSRRLGQNKSLLEVDGQPLLARVVHTVAGLSDDVIVVTNNPVRYEPLALPARLVSDRERGIGSLMGIYSGLGEARYPYALAVACDMPFLSLPLVRYMLTFLAGYEVVIPRLGGMLEPLHAIYSQSCLPFMEQLLGRGKRRIVAFFHQVRVRYIDEEDIDRFDPQHLSFVNVNTAADLERVQALLARQGVSTGSNFRR